ncbi:hypothetical protein JKP88DRAFT_326072 [Tribonema minus]|uniref:Uncharacterized protein n=1 Tax=Tribonema minus TaxID=303371 RepID=A0A835YU36_9STRA|nr:hypothetical protein JKP88DRAFT_326072 [Tribonema minus]
MLKTKVFFTSAYMARLDKEGSLKQLSRLLKERRGLKRLDRLKFYLKSVAGMTGTILFWNGVFNLTFEGALAVKRPLLTQLAAIVAGGAVVLYVMHTEDAAAVNHDDEAFIKDAVQGNVRAFAERPLVMRLATFMKAFACNAAQVVMWWGVELLAEQYMFFPKPWGAVLLVLVGLVVLKGVDRLDVNMGLDDDDVEEDADAPAGGMGMAQGSTYLSPRPPRTPWCQTFLNGCELIAVVWLWTGCEWFIWDNYVFQHTVLRDALYTLTGFVVLLLTGTFIALAGVVSPMAMYGKVHRQLQAHEVVPLLLATTPTLATQGGAVGFWSPALSDACELAELVPQQSCAVSTKPAPLEIQQHEAGAESALPPRLVQLQSAEVAHTAARTVGAHFGRHSSI